MLPHNPYAVWNLNLDPLLYKTLSLQYSRDISVPLNLVRVMSLNDTFVLFLFSTHSADLEIVLGLVGTLVHS